MHAGGEGAPDLGETLTNLAINGAAVAVFGFVFRRDLRGSQADRKIVEREEALARLQVIFQSISMWQQSCHQVAGGACGFLLCTNQPRARAVKWILLDPQQQRSEMPLLQQVKLGEDRVVTVDTLRGTTRPVLVTGTKGQVSRAIKAAGPLIDALRTRGLCVIPLVLSEDDPSAKLAALKAEFRWVSTLFSQPESERLPFTKCLW